MTQLDWEVMRDAERVEGFKAETMVLLDGEEVRAPFNGGWLNYADATHIEGSPQSIGADTPTLLTIDGEGATSEQRYRRGVDPAVWNASTNTFQPNAVGEAYLVRITMRVAKLSSSDTTVELDLGIGLGFSTIIADERKPLTKGQGVTDNLSFTFPIFCLETFGLNGGRFFITATENVTIWNKAIFVQRLFTP